MWLYYSVLFFLNHTQFIVFNLSTFYLILTWFLIVKLHIIIVILRYQQFWIVRNIINLDTTIISGLVCHCPLPSNALAGILDQDIGSNITTLLFIKTLCPYDHWISFLILLILVGWRWRLILHIIFKGNQFFYLFEILACWIFHF